MTPRKVQNLCGQFMAEQFCKESRYLELLATGRKAIVATRMDEMCHWLPILLEWRAAQENKFAKAAKEKKTRLTDEQVLEGSSTITPRSGQSHVQLDFCPLTRTIEEAYDLEFRDALGYFKNPHTRKFTQDLLKGLVIPERTRLPEMEFAEKFIKFVLPYVDHWHYLLEHDFAGLNRGGSNTMNIAPVPDEPSIFANIRSIYRNEIGNRSFMNNAKSVDFMVDW